MKETEISKTEYHELRNRIADLTNALSDDDFMTLDDELPSLLREICNVKVNWEKE